MADGPAARAFHPHEPSGAERFLKLPLTERKRALRALRSEGEFEALLYDWRFWARPEQLCPAGPGWITWGIIAGRGAGKTRSAAEFLRAEVESGRSRYPFLIGADAGDVRDVMVEGESGIMAISPPWFKPKYEPSKRRLTFPNGVIAHLFGAHDPDSLRGPQCLIAGTLVTMADGSLRPIETIVAGDLVATRVGPRRVTWSGKTGDQRPVYRLRTLDGRTLIGTGAHPVYVEGAGFVPLRHLRPGDPLCVGNASSGTATSGTCGSVATTRRTSGSIAKSGDPCMETSPKASTSTTSTRTSGTTIRRTWDSSLARIIHAITRPIFASIKRRRSLAPARRSSASRPSDAELSIRASFAAPTIEVPPSIRVASARRAASTARARFALKASSVSANGAGNGTPRPSACNDFARSGATDARPRTGHMSRVPSHAQRAAGASRPNGVTNDSVVAGAPSNSTEVRSVDRLLVLHDVFDITVETAHEFIANGIVVHNSDLIWCDEIAKWKYATQAWDNAVLGNRLGTHPRRVFTTTPKPIRLVRLLMGKDPSQRGQPPDPTVVLARTMSTYDNLGNLAPSFIQEVVSKYQGTRLGSQELLGQLLEDTPGALWTLQMIEDARSYTVPETFVRIVVAVDPAVTAHEESNETGIIVCAKDGNGLGWVLRDVSGRYSPDQWASKVAEMFHHYHADRVIGEVNNGGDLVETMLRSKDPSISYKAVHASRGKFTRAEPIAALYERHLIRHYGEFEDLEAQMTTYAPDQIPSAEEKRKEKSISPDRMDALVWGMSDLMLRRGGLFVA